MAVSFGSSPGLNLDLDGSHARNVGVAVGLRSSILRNPGPDKRRPDRGARARYLSHVSVFSIP